MFNLQTPPDPMQNKEVVIETVSNLIKVQPTFDFTQNFDQFEAIEDIHIEILEEPVDLPPLYIGLMKCPSSPVEKKHGMNILEKNSDILKCVVL